MTADAAGNTTLPVVISGDSLIYDNASQEIFGRGHIILKHADTVIFADLIYVNPDTGDVSAEGNVLVEAAQAQRYIRTNSITIQKPRMLTRRTRIF